MLTWQTLHKGMRKASGEATS